MKKIEISAFVFMVFVIWYLLGNMYPVTTINNFENTCNQSGTNLIPENIIDTAIDEEAKTDVVETEAKDITPPVTEKVDTPKELTVSTQAGFITNVYSKWWKNYIDIDYIQKKARDQNDSAVGPIIINENSKIRTFEISSNVKILLLDKDNWSSSSMFSDLVERWNSVKLMNSNSDGYVWGLVNITLTNGIVTMIDEVYIP